MIDSQSEKNSSASKFLVNEPEIQAMEIECDALKLAQTQANQLQANESQQQQEKVIDEQTLKRKLQNTDCNLLMGAADTLLLRLQKQLEFYFGDSNLQRDRYLQQLIAKDRKGCVEIEIFLHFNRIKRLFEHQKSKKERLQLIQNAIELSDVLTLTKHKLKVKRVIPFAFSKRNSSGNRNVHPTRVQTALQQKPVILEQNKQVQEEVQQDRQLLVSKSLQPISITDSQSIQIASQQKFEPRAYTSEERTVYVENLPHRLSNEHLAEIMQKSGQILNIHLPKVRHSQQRLNRGYAFIEFLTPEMALQAKKDFNNKIPDQLMEVDEMQKQSWKVLMKCEWDRKKQELHELRDALRGTREEEQTEQRKRRLFIEKEVELVEGCLLEFSNLEKLSDARQAIKILVSHVAEPAYVEYLPRDKKIVVRFNSQQDRQAFLSSQGVYKEDIVEKGVEMRCLEGEEEKGYWQRVQDAKNQMRKKNYQLKYQKQNARIGMI